PAARPSPGCSSSCPTSAAPGPGARRGEPMPERDDTAVPAPDPGAPAPSAPRASPPSLRRLGRLVRKELSEILRDRRTILTLVLMPLLLYPLLAMAFPQFLAGLEAGKAGPLRIGVTAPRPGDDLVFL